MLMTSGLYAIWQLFGCGHANPVLCYVFSVIMLRNSFLIFL